MKMTIDQVVVFTLLTVAAMLTAGWIGRTLDRERTAAAMAESAHADRVAMGGAK